MADTILTQDVTDKEQRMLTDVEKELHTRFELLPKELQETILSSDYQMKLFELAKKYKLTYDQLGELELETTSVLLGVSRPEDYNTEIAKALGIKKETLEPLIKDINEQVFSQIRIALGKLYSKDKTEEELGVPEEAKVSLTAPTENKIQKEETAILEKTGISIMADIPVSQKTDAFYTPTRGDINTALQNPPKIEPRRLNDIPTPMQAEVEARKKAVDTQRENELSKTIPTNSPTTPTTPNIKPMPAPPMAPKIPTVVSQPMNMVAQKLAGQVTSTETKTTYAPIPNSAKITDSAKTPAPTFGVGSNGNDHYREAIE